MVGTVGRLILVQPADRVAEGPTQYSAPGYPREVLRRSASACAAGTYAYGSMPAACTSPSQMYRYRSLEFCGGADTAATWTPTPPSKISTMATRAATDQSSQAAARTASHAASSSGSGLIRAGSRPGRTSSSTIRTSIVSAAQIAAIWNLELIAV